jgi:hypothetical protein
MAEQDLAMQTAVMKELTSGIRDIQSIVDGRLVHCAGPEPLGNLQSILANCDSIVSAHERQTGTDAA